MSSETTERRVCRFGLYEADLEAGILKRHGIPLRLQEQPFRILGFLLERPGEIVSREELRNRLWPEGTFVEFDGSLNTALMKLRAALNDDPENPRFVETVPKKGYRFIAPVQVIGGAGDLLGQEVSDAVAHVATIAAVPSGRAVQEVSPHSDSAAREVRAPYRTTAGIALFLAGCAVALVVALRFWPSPEPSVVKVTQLTHTGRVAPESRVVTDGARLYFISRDGGLWNLMTTSIHGGSVEKLPAPFPNTSIFDVSPDRTQLLIGPYHHEGDDIPVWVWPAHGGVPHRLGDVTASEASWSPNGAVIALTQGNRLLTTRRDGSGTAEIQKFMARPHSLVWSGDGSKIRFTLTNLDRATDEMWEINADGSGLRRILPNVSSELHDTSGAWSSDERYFLFTAGSDSRLQPVMDSVSNVWALRERGGLFSRGRRSTSELTHGPVSYRNLTGTGDSDRFFALGTHPEYQVIRVEPGTEKSSIILPDAGATDVDVTPDGEWLVYTLRENGALWKSRRSGKERAELTAIPPGAIAPQWSPDGKEVLFTAFFLGKKPQIFVVSSSGGTPRAILPANTAGSSASGDWSHDGAQILFEYSERNVSDLRILDRAAGKIVSIPGSEGMVQARWSPDGRYIAALNSRTRQLMLYSVKDQSWSVLAETNSAQGMRWSADSNFVYYQEMSDPEQSVYRVRLGHGAPERVLGFASLLASMASQCHFTGVAPDGAVYATVDRGGTDLYSLDLKLP
ncbi:MAG TPA: winged helix-turn-helix domain-containing protein [Dongiaceae bacterium]|nr:winged helix-turn-helix domain-containing protein [Dongiaceae bacterium]